MNYEIGKTVKMHRKALSLRLEDVSEMTGLPPAYINDIENEFLLPSFDASIKLFNAFKITFNDCADNKTEKEILIKKIKELHLDKLDDKDNSLFHFTLKRLSKEKS